MGVFIGQLLLMHALKSVELLVSLPAGALERKLMVFFKLGELVSQGLAIFFELFVVVLKPDQL
jgi:hypothetical protein